ncbi:MAG: hypothetical protein HYW49_07710 [Deltaproteobacteria bacterium]|nr:hypothetical protein [Deltaproteobacteria bacterium]
MRVFKTLYSSAAVAFLVLAVSSVHARAQNVTIAPALQVATASAVERGHETGNGGDAFAVEFQLIGRAMVDDLRAHGEVDRRGIDVDALAAKIENRDVRVVTTKELLYLNEERKDAINRDGNTIIVSLAYWPELNPLVKRIMVLHEYLGLLDVEVGHYQISIDVVTDLENTIARAGGGQGVKKLSGKKSRELNDQLTSLREKMRTPGMDADDEFGKLIDQINDFFRDRDSAAREAKTQAQIARAKREAAYPVIRCARRIVARKRGGHLGVDVAALYLTKLREEVSRPDGGRLEEIAKLAGSCDANYDKLSRKKAGRWDQKRELTKIAPTIPAAVKALVGSFIEVDFVTCAWGGISASAHLFLGGELGAKAGYCVAADGRRWVDVAAIIGFGLGGEASVTILGGKRTFQTRNGYGWFGRFPLWITATDYLHESRLIFSLKCSTGRINDLGIQEDPRCWHHGEANTGDREIEGFGIGIGNANGNDIELPRVKLIPLGTNWNFLFKRLVAK